MIAPDSLFTSRFIEVCGSSEPVQIQRLLNVSYQAAKNYLHGRLPGSTVLTTIAQRTPYSINWLLTGEGEKLVRPNRPEDTPLTAGQIRDLVRRECVEVINEVLRSQEIPRQKVVVLQSGELKSEKVKDAVTTYSEK